MEVRASHVPPDEASWIRAHADSLEIRFMDYDWSLNDMDTTDIGSR